MSVLSIVKYPDKVLRDKTVPVGNIDGGLQKLIDDMIETMYAAPGVGLAANQVGISQQLAVIDVGIRDEKSRLIVLVNPEIVHLEGEIESEEGCLSIPDYTTVLKRAMKVLVKGYDREGGPVEIEAEGLLARALQHEIDHLNGILFVDRMGRIKREFFKKRYSRTIE
ncbi:MAG: peptide deformylase [Nitrospirae bacterium]|nr:peptide deformylase [Nitrospirota bacterium]